MHRLLTRRTAIQLRRYSSIEPSQPPPPRKHTWEDGDHFDLLSRAATASIGLAAIGMLVTFIVTSPASETGVAHGLIFNPTAFTNTFLTRTDKCESPNSRMMALHLPSSKVPTRDFGNHFAPIWHVFVKDDDIMVERPYTPLYGMESKGQMTFWIKKYDHGEVGRWLHSKSRGDSIDVRGPVKSWDCQDGEWDEIVMISGGTGITPFVQLFHNAIQTSMYPNLEKTKFTLLHSSRTPSELPPAIILDPIISYASQNPDRLKVKLFVDSKDPPPSKTTNLKTDDPVPDWRDYNYSVRRISKSDIRNCLPQPWLRLLGYSSPPPTKTLFLVCGPEPMISAIAGPRGPYKQGPVGGMLKEFGLDYKTVKKL